MWKMIVAHGTPPTRIMRYCCRELKEGGGMGRVVVTGIRAAESGRRAKKRKIYEIPQCGQRGGGKYVLNPIFDWLDSDVWQFIKNFNLPYCKLYDQGRKRLGCILCPLSKKSEKYKDIEQYPRTTARYKRAIKDMMNRNIGRGKEYKRNFKDEEELFNWWITTPPKTDFETYGLFD